MKLGLALVLVLLWFPVRAEVANGASELSPGVQTFVSTAIPLDKNTLDPLLILGWSVSRASDITQLSFGDYQSQIEKLAPYFSEAGLLTLKRALADGGVIERLRAQQGTVRGEALTAPTLVGEGIVDGKYQWTVTLPMVLIYSGGGKVYRERRLLSLVIERIPAMSRSRDPMHPPYESIAISLCRFEKEG